ncbi:MAG: nitrate/nitrite-specific signal transduction histidine kinase [Maribacter sp.]|jgi:nitrate/nitrite-specific signal transduction histidine kinase
MFNFSVFNKQIDKYYLLVATIIALTLVIQSITQYSLQKQARTALLINIAGKQRMLGQKVLTNFYECRLLKCNYADMKLGLERLYATNLALQDGDSRLEPLKDPEIQKNFDKLEADINYMYASLQNSDSLETISFESLSSTVGRFISVMDTIYHNFKRSQKMILEH